MAREDRESMDHSPSPAYGFVILLLLEQEQSVPTHPYITTMRCYGPGGKRHWGLLALHPRVLPSNGAPLVEAGHSKVDP